MIVYISWVKIKGLMKAALLFTTVSRFILICVYQQILKEFLETTKDQQLRKGIAKYNEDLATNNIFLLTERRSARRPVFCPRSLYAPKRSWNASYSADSFSRRHSLIFVGHKVLSYSQYIKEMILFCNEVIEHSLMCLRHMCENLKGLED